VLWSGHNKVHKTNCTLCFKKRGVELLTICSSTVNRFWKFFHCWKQHKKLSAR